MKLTYSFCIILGLATIFQCCSKSNTKNYDLLVYKDSTKSFDERVVDLLPRMTLDEKVAQLQCIWAQKKEIFNNDSSFSIEKAKQFIPHGIGQIGRLSEGRTAKNMAEFANQLQKYLIEETRLGIPAMLHEEGLHGIMANQCVSFPQPIGLACSWNPELAQKTYAHTAKELRVRGAQHVFTPVLDVARDARWGRVEETFGEDPYLVSRMGLAAITGFQGNTSKKLHSDKVIATLKHFAAHGQPESGTNCAPANYSERVIREIFLYPFKVAIEEGNALSVMASYNEIDGVPSHTNRWLIQDVLRGEMGFKGFIVSDYFAIKELVTRHHVVADSNDAGIEALKTGIDIETPDPDGYLNLAELVKSGKLEEKYVDEACKRVLYYKFFMGLFDDPYVDPAKAEAFVNDSTHRQLAYDAASESVVLLKNGNNTLPLDLQKNLKIAVIGPNADRELNGGYPGNPTHNVTVLKGIQERFGKNAIIKYAKGCGITQDGKWFLDPVLKTDPTEDKKLIAEAVQLANQSDIVILAIGGNELTSREAWAESHMGDRTDLQMVGMQDELVDAIAKTGKPMVALLFHGRPLAINNVTQKADAILDCWYIGQETGYAVADILSGKTNPSGRLSISIPRSVGHIPCFYNYKPTARRGYLFDSISPLYAFGYGLSYTQFEISAPTISKTEMTANDSCIVTVKVSNQGKYTGKEVIQLYIRDEVSNITRPVKELKAFQKIMLNAGESKQVSFTISEKQLQYYGLDMKLTVEPGDFQIMVGSSSQDKDLKSVKLTIL